MEASGDSNSSAFAPRPATHPLPALPLQAVPVTLAPFVLMPDATPLLPSLNIQPTAQKSLRDVLPSLSGTVMDAAQSDALTRNIEAVLNTKPTIIPQDLLPLPPVATCHDHAATHIHIPIDVNYAQNGEFKSDPSLENHVQALMASHALQMQQMELLAQKRESTPQYTSEEQNNSAKPRHLPQLEALLPLPLSQTPPASGSSSYIPLSSSPLPHMNEVSVSSTSQTADVITDVESSPDYLPTPTPNRKKRARESVNYAAIDNGDEKSASEDLSEGHTKRSKTKLDSPSFVAASSAPLAPAGASRRFGSRLHALFLWYDAAQSQKPEETPFPSVSCLSDLYLDLPCIDVGIELGEDAVAAKFVACLRLIFKMCANAPISELTVLSALDSPSLASSMALSLQVGLTAALCMLYLLTHPTFDRRQLSDECVEETNQILVSTLTGFVQSILDRSDDGTLVQAPETKGNTTASHTKTKVSRRKKEDPLDTPYSASHAVDLASSAVYTWQRSIFAQLMTQVLSLLHESLEMLCKLLTPVTASTTSLPPSLPEEHVISMMKIARISLFSHGLETALQTTAMKLFQALLHSAGASYRPSLVQDILDSIADLNRGTRNPADLKHESMHVVTSLVLQLLHASSESLVLPSNAQITSPGHHLKTSIGAMGAHQTKGRPQALCRAFVKQLFDAILDRNDAKEDVYVMVLDRVVADLIGVVFRPEFPAAEMLLKDVLQHILVILSSPHVQGTNGSSTHSGHTSSAHHGTGTASANSSKVSEKLKTTLGTWLSLIGTKLVSAKLFMTTANLTKRPEQGDAETRLLQEGSRCPLCTGAYSGKKMASCTRCLRWFHVECFGIVAPPQDVHCEWFCDACLEGWIYDMLVQDSDSEFSKAKFVKDEDGEALSRPSIDAMEVDEPIGVVSQSNGVSSSKADPSTQQEVKLEENAKNKTNFETKTLHFAMKLLILNLLNDKREKSLELTDAKRFLLRQWMLENEESGSATEKLVLEQWDSSSSTPLHWPLGPFRPTNTQLDANPYVRLLNQYVEKNTSARTKIGLLPSHLACQIFLIRFSMASTTTTSIFSFFPKIIDQFVTMMNAEGPKFRALALRAITNMVEADMSLLREKHVYDAVEARLIDPSPLTREKALNMLGRFIVMNPSVLPQYAALIRDRVEDSAISVRKRAVRIIRSICLLVPSSPHVVTFCSALAKRIARHGEGIKDMVLTLFRDLWFVSDEGKKSLLNDATEDLMDPDLPKADLSVSMTSTIGEERSMEQPLSTFEKVDQMLSILKETLRVDSEREASWFQDLMEHIKAIDFHGSNGSSSSTSNGATAIANSVTNTGKSASSKSSRSSKSSKSNSVANAGTGNPFLGEIVSFLVDFLCGVGEEADLEYERHTKCEQLIEEHADNATMKRAAQAALAQNKEEWIKKKLLYSLALSYVAQSLPVIVGEHFHQLRMLLSVETPTPTTHALEKKILETILGVLETIIPIIRYPADDVWTSILKDVSQLLKNHGMPVIAASIKCAAAVSRRTKSSNWIKSLYAALATSLKNEISTHTNTQAPSKKQTPAANSTVYVLHPQSIIRFMFTLSMILKAHPLDPPSNFKEKDLSTVNSIRAHRYGPHVEEVYSFIVHFWKHGDRDVKTSAVLSLGHLAPGSPGIFVRTISEEIIASALSPSSLEQLKAQALKTLHEFLSEEAERMKLEVKVSASVSSSSRVTPSKSARAKETPKDVKSKKANGKTRRNSGGAQDAKYASNSPVDSESESASTATTARHMEEQNLDNIVDGYEDDLADGKMAIDDGNFDEEDHASASSVTHHSADMGLSSTIVELYMQRVLSLGLDKSIAIRNAALSLLEHILKMGLTHPAHCVPTLVALETDDVLGESAHRCLSTLDMARVLNRIAVGIQLSFQFQRTIYRTPKAIRPVSDGGLVTYHSNLGRLYSLFAENGRVARNNFLAAAFGLFEVHSDKKGSSGFDALFVTYLTLLIAQLPFNAQEEALYAVYQCNVLVSSLGSSVLNRLKKFYEVEEQKTQCPKEGDMQDAIIAWHLLMLKQFLRSFYALDSERCRNYMPTEAQSTPTQTHVVYINIQEYLHKINPNFEGFLQDSDSSKRPDACKRIYKNLKTAIKAQEEDYSTHATRAERAKAKRRHSAGGSTTTDLASLHDGSTGNEAKNYEGHGSMHHQQGTTHKTPTKRKTNTKGTPKTSSAAKPKAKKKAIKPEEDEDYEE